MATAFEMVILRMKDFGMFQFFFPFILTSAIFYGLLRKSKLFGEPEKNIAVNAIISLVAAFMVMAYPIIAGVPIEDYMQVFFFQGTLAALATMVGLLIVSMFMPPDLPTKLAEVFKGKWRGGLVVVFVLIGFGILVSSGLWGVFFPGGVVAPAISEDMIITLGIVLLLVGGVAVIIFTGGK